MLQEKNSQLKSYPVNPRLTKVKWLNAFLYFGNFKQCKSLLSDDSTQCFSNFCFCQACWLSVSPSLPPLTLSLSHIHTPGTQIHGNQVECIWRFLDNRFCLQTISFGLVFQQNVTLYKTNKTSLHNVLVLFLFLTSIIYNKIYTRCKCI